MGTSNLFEISISSGHVTLRHIEDTGVLTSLKREDQKDDKYYLVINNGLRFKATSQNMDQSYESSSLPLQVEITQQQYENLEEAIKNHSAEIPRINISGKLEISLGGTCIN